MFLSQRLQSPALPQSCQGKLEVAEQVTDAVEIAGGHVQRFNYPQGAPRTILTPLILTNYRPGRGAG